jgi:hypothetical protein
VFSGCSSKIIGSEETSNYNGSVKNEVNVVENSTSSLSNVEENSLTRDIEDFILSIKNNDAESLKHIISPSGLLIIRNFSSGNNARGKDIRNLYSIDKIPANLQFEISGEVPITLHELFNKSQQGKVNNIPVIKINNSSFSFKDDIETNNYGPSTAEVRDLCSELISNKDYSPKIFELGDKEVVLTESSLIAETPVGLWAIFEKLNNKYLLRAIIELR